MLFFTQDLKEPVKNTENFHFQIFSKACRNFPNTNLLKISQNSSPICSDSYLLTDS